MVNNMQEKSLKEQQLDALEELYHYSQKLIPAIETVSKELAGERQDDTEEYLKSVLNGINWIIEVLNRTMELVNEEEIVIDKDKINEDILKLGEAIREKNDEKMAEVLKEKVLPFIINVSTRAAVVTNQVFN
ncbi:molecular chaperone [Anaerocolumna jejuensis]|uniref:molecular chaperone n=1 Tax=Anaerocolumna jejuensis TaxID=259063 RepID=UPI003F7BD9F7